MSIGANCCLEVLKPGPEVPGVLRFDAQKNWQIVNFISKAASYVKEVTPQPSVRKELENEAIDFTAEMISYEKIKQYMKSRFPLTRSKSNPIDLENYFELLKGIRNKVRVCIFN